MRYSQEQKPHKLEPLHKQPYQLPSRIGSHLARGMTQVTEEK